MSELDGGMGVGDRLRSGGLTGLIGGKEKRRSKLIGSGIAVLVFLGLAPIVGVLFALLAVVAYATLSGLTLRLRKRRAGVSLDSTDY
jgi:hypothetical protein